MNMSFFTLTTISTFLLFILPDAKHFFTYPGLPSSTRIYVTVIVYFLFSAGKLQKLWRCIRDGPIGSDGVHAVCKDASATGDAVPGDSQLRDGAGFKDPPPMMLGMCKEMLI